MYHNSYLIKIYLLFIYNYISYQMLCLYVCVCEYERVRRHWPLEVHVHVIIISLLKALLIRVEKIKFFESFLLHKKNKRTVLFRLHKTCNGHRLTFIFFYVYDKITFLCSPKIYILRVFSP